MTDDTEVDDATYLAGRRDNAYGRVRAKDPWSAGLRPTSRRLALKSIGPVLYAARLPDGVIKFGYTADLYVRLTHFGQAELLALKAGTPDEEVALHQRLAGQVHHGREWYNPTSEVMAVVNEWRTALGLEAA